MTEETCDMMKRNRKKIAIVLILFVVSVMMIGLALATIAGRISIWLISIGFLLMLTSLFIFMTYFKE